MGDFIDSFKNEASSLLQNKKSLVSILLLGILVLAIPIGMELLKYQRIIKSRATSDPIVFVESDNVFQKDGKWFTKTKNVSVQITSPLGPAGAPAGTAAPTQAPADRATAAPTASGGLTVIGLTYSCSSDNSKVNLSWNTVTGATGYVLRLNRVDGTAPDWNNPVSDINNPADRYISVNDASVNNLKVDSGKDYSWDVQVNGQSNKVFGPNFKCGNIANPAPTTPSATNPSSVVLTAPTNITKTCNGTTAIFSWTAGTGAADYAVRLNKEPYTDWMGPGDEMQGITTTSLSLPIVPNAKYQWRVVSRANGKEESSPEVIFDCPGTYNTPVLVGRCDQGVNLKLAWSSVAGASKYLVRIDDTVNGWGGYDIQTGDIVEDNITATSYISNKGQAGHNYQAWVQSVDSSNNLSNVSNKVTVSCK